MDTGPTQHPHASPEPSGQSQPWKIPPFEGTPIYLGEVTSPSGAILVVEMALEVLAFGFEAGRPPQDIETMQRIVSAGAGAAPVHEHSSVVGVVLAGLPTDKLIRSMAFDLRTRMTLTGSGFTWTFVRASRSREASTWELYILNSHTFCSQTRMRFAIGTRSKPLMG